MMIAITGATGQLGRLVVNCLLKTVPADKIVALARDPSKAAGIAARDVAVRRADYNDPALLDEALNGVKKLLLISSNEVGQRVAQHKNVIDAAKRHGVKLFVYTSLLRADVSSLNLAKEHVPTEADIKVSGLPYVILRNGWYTENYLGSVAAAVKSGTYFGCAGEGRISSATRADYAEAAAKVLASGGPVGQTLELAGDTSYTLADLAAEISRQSGKQVIYKNVSAAEYQKILTDAGVPDAFAALIAGWDVDASKGALFDEGRHLSKLIGRPTTPLSEAVKAALAN